MKKATSLLIIVLFGAIIFSVSSCKKNDGDPGQIEIVLVADTSAPYQKVSVDVQKISIHLVTISGHASWIDLPTNKNIYDLLQYSNGNYATLVNPVSSKSGKITQVRFIIGNGNTLKKNNITYNLSLPLGKETGITLSNDLKVIPDEKLCIVLDFNPKESVINISGNNYQLVPVIKAL